VEPRNGAEALPPQISGVGFQTMFPQKCQKLLLKGYLAVMLLLRGDVPFHLIHLRVAYREGRISGLPAESFPGRKLLMHPARGVRFHYPEQVRDRFGGGHRQQEMNVISRTVDNQRLASTLSDDPTQAKRRPDSSGVNSGTRSLVEKMM
jgi:hypothetical protein